LDYRENAKDNAVHLKVLETLQILWYCHTHAFCDNRITTLCWRNDLLLSHFFTCIICGQWAIKRLLNIPQGQNC